jgi:hypothetical protein
MLRIYNYLEMLMEQTIRMMITETKRANKNPNGGASPKHVNLVGHTTFMIWSSNDGFKKCLGDISNNKKIIPISIPVMRIVNKFREWVSNETQ